MCENCGGDNVLQCAHIASRKFVATYTNLRNAYCLCASCHRFFTDHPVEFARYVQRTWAGRYYDEIFRQARQGYKATDDFWEARISFLQDVYSKITSGEITLAEARILDTGSIGD